MVSTVYQVTCGVSTTLSSVEQRVVGRYRFDGEDVQARRRPAGRRAARRPARPRRRSAPREVLTSTASGFIRASASRVEQCRGRRRSAADAARRCRCRRAGPASGRQPGWPSSRVLVCRTCGAHGVSRSSRPLGDVAVADQPDGAAADVAHRLAEARVRRPAPALRGWRGPARAAGAARPASAARCPRRPTGRSRRACSPPRCRSRVAASTSMVFTPAPSLCTSRTAARARGRRPTMGRSTCQITSASGSSR